MPGTLDYSPARVIQQLLVDLLLGNAYNSSTWPVFSAQEPDLPDNCITVYDTSGERNGRTNPDSEVQTKHSFQVRVRSTTHDVGFAKANGIAISMDNVYNRTVHIADVNYLVMAIVDRGDVLTLGKGLDPEDRRSLFTINAFVRLRQQ